MNNGEGGWGGGGGGGRSMESCRIDAKDSCNINISTTCANWGGKT